MAWVRAGFGRAGHVPGTKEKAISTNRHTVSDWIRPMMTE